MSVLEPPTEEQLTYIYNQLNMTPESLERDVKYLMDWISQQPHLPDGIDERWIRSSLIARKNSVEKVKHSIDLCYTVKGLAPEFFEKRDPLDPELHEIFTKQFAYPLPKLTPEGSRVLLYNIMDLEVKDYEFSKSTKVVLMMGAVQLLEDICRNWVLVFDLRGFTFNHLSTITIPQLKKFLMIAQIHVHTDGFGTLFDSVPREIFPKDYGGEEPPFRDLLEKWNKKIIEYRDWFSKDDNRKVDESKRPGKPKSYDEMFGFEGSFRKLSVD
ncbi:alpha-tocopherol transfer protein-like isoform X2 [Anabrus simplex]|uniref:alpha-tocopherol transfer protein-like isoform X2 n=1 Tax=Anabrus simplex TaxID=316456 RepID=UPI0035A3413F